MKYIGLWSPGLRNICKTLRFPLPTYLIYVPLEQKLKKNLMTMPIIFENKSC